MALIAFLTIFGISIALGWHYALDGVVGAGAAIACHLALRSAFRARPVPLTPEPYADTPPVRG